MIKNKKHIVLFFVIVVSILSLINYKYKQIENNQFKLIDQQLNTLKKSNKIYFGSSHTVFGIYPENRINIGGINEPYYLTLEKIKLIDPDTVILSSNFQNILFNYDLSIERGLLQEIKFKYLFTYLHDSIQDKFHNLMSFETKAYQIIKNILPALGSNLKTDTSKNLIGGFAFYANSERKNGFNVPLRMQEEFLSNEQPYSEIQIEGLTAIVDYCYKNKIKLIIHSTPLFKDFTQSIKPKHYLKFKQLINKLQDEYNFEYHDNSSIFKDKSLFYDLDHLNTLGAKKYSHILDNQINSNFQRIDFKNIHQFDMAKIYYSN